MTKKTKVVEATGTAVHIEGDPSLGQLVERAMVKAIEACNAKGITNPVVILDAKLKARDAIMSRINEAPAQSEE